MKNTKSMSVAAVLVALTAGGMVFPTLLGVTPAAAQAKKKEVSLKLGKQFQEASALVQQQKKYKEGLAKLEELKAAPGKTAYENFLIAELSTAAYTGLQDYGNAAKSMEAAVETGQAPESQKAARQKSIAQTYYLAKNYPKFNDLSAKYMKEYGVDADMQLLVAQALYQERNYKGAAEAGRAAIKAAEAKQAPVREDMLQLIMSAEHEAGNAAGEQAVLEQLVQRFPKASYWNALLINAQKNIKGSTKTQLDIYRIMYNAGVMVKTEEYFEAAQLAIQAGFPTEAEKLIKKGMEKGVLGQGAQKDRHARLLAMANTQIAERNAALANDETEAKAAATGDADIKIGESYWVRGQNDKALEALQRGIKKGVKDKDDAQLRLGIVYITTGKRTQAADAFKAITPNSPSAQVARLWTLYSASKSS